MNAWFWLISFLTWQSSHISDSNHKLWLFFFFIQTVLWLYNIVCKDQVHPHPTISDGYNNFCQLLYYFANIFLVLNHIGHMKVSFWM